MDRRIILNQRIIIALLCIVVVANLLIIAGFYGIIATPEGMFAGGGPRVTDCYFRGLNIYGEGATSGDALQMVLEKQDQYAYLFCNGRFRGDLEYTAIPSIGCPACKPDCEPTVVDAGAPNVSRTVDGRRVRAVKRVDVFCTSGE